MTADGAADVRWAHRVPRDLIRRLYDSEAAGRLDEALLDDVGTRLALRCESILAIAEAKRGTVRCPRCAADGRESVIRHDGEGADDEPLRCPDCGWGTTWGAFRKTWMRRQLNEGGAESIFREYLARWKAATSVTWRTTNCTMWRGRACLWPRRTIRSSVICIRPARQPH